MISALEITALALQAFAADLAARPPMSLRAGNDVDSYQEQSDFDATLDGCDDAYLESFAWGLPHLDAASWRHYVPRFIDYALRHRDGSFAGDSFVMGLRPPDREPPRFASLDADQECAVVEFLTFLALGEPNAYAEDAQIALEEWWLPDATYRPRPKLNQESDPN